MIKGDKMNIALVRRATRLAAASLALALLAAASYSLTLLAQTPNLRPGKYEDTEEISIPGRPGKMPPRKYVRCFTAEDLKDWNNLFKEDDNRGSCKIADRKATATTLVLTKECSNAAGVFTATIDVTVTSPDSYHAVVNMKQSSGRATNPMLQGSTTTATAKWIGECTK
jgi:uncharacterized protein DUF3617